MRALRGLFLFWLAITAWALLGGGAGCSSPPPPDPHEPAGVQNFTSPQSNPIVLSPDRAWVYVANTTSNSVSFIRTSTFKAGRTVSVGMEPVGLAVRPDGLELWVSNHVSDSVSVIDTNSASASFGQVIETIQTLDAGGATSFDEPVGIAFASNSKAYVALSSTNQVAIVNATTYQVTGMLHITAQEPRALTVRNGLLYVAAFESGNKSELSACINPPNGSNGVGDQCSLGSNDLQTFVTNPNIPGQVKNIVVDPDVPDRDVFVFDTSNDTLSRTVTGVGTLLYDLAVEADGTIWVTETNARNALNGNDGLTLSGLSGRMFENELSRVAPGGTTATRFKLEPGICVAGSNPGTPCVSDTTCTGGGTCTGVTTLANSLATPYGAALSADDSTLLLTAAGASRLASFDVSGASPVQRAVIDVGSIPKGLAFDSPAGAGGTAYVLNTLGNSVTKVTVDATGSLTPAGTVMVGSDPTPTAVRLGNIAFNNALASTSGNHSCASCHPDSNTDQLLWRIGGACSAAIGCDPAEDEIRTTMPVRGLEHTVPLHWDGTLGDPFGGSNGAIGSGGSIAPSCTPGDADGDHDCFLHLVNASLTGVMCLQPCTGGNNNLSAQEKDDMATFLASVSYPPARRRRLSDALSSTATGAATIQLSPNMPSTSGRARQGMIDFFIDVGGLGAPAPQTCADADGGCHPPALLVSTNSATLNGFDAPTMRGLTDRFLQFSMGPTNAEEVLVGANNGAVGGISLPLAIRWEPNEGFEELTTFGAAFGVFTPVYGMGPLNLWEAFEETSTGFSGAQGRQVTLNTSTAGLAGTQNLLASLEAADDRGVVNLRGSGLRNGAPMQMSYSGGSYNVAGELISRAQLLSEAQNGATLVTLTAQLRQNVGSSPRPLLSTNGTIGTDTVIDDPPLPRIASTLANPPFFTVTGIDVSASAGVFVDGQRQTTATLSCNAGVTGSFCNDGVVQIDLTVRPSNGTHMLQVQNPSGLLSNELPLCVALTTSFLVCLND